ncbi:MAG: DNA adenine methylase [Planctomycetes bacterium]|nr:DNA adenine methylase [Planctomycetota bacterium]
MNHRPDDNQGTQALCDPPAVDCAQATTPASPLQWYGSLQSHARKIAALLPPHDLYAEPFAGGLSVLLSKRISEREHIADINADLINFWRVIQRSASRRRLIAQVEMTPYSRAVYGDCIAMLNDGGGDAVRRAWAFLITCNQGRNGLGAFASRWSHGKSGSNQHADSWANLPAKLEQAGRRMQGVRIECVPYDKMLEIDSPQAVILLDPPYSPETRLKPKVYEHEFTDDDHRCLLHIVRKLKSRVILCGYRNRLYDEQLCDGWQRRDFKGRSYTGLRTNGHSLRRTLSVWTNYEPPSK